MNTVVKLTVEINGQVITRNYKFALGQYEDKDWYGEMVDMYDTVMESEPQGMSADDYQDINPHKDK